MKSHRLFLAGLFLLAGLWTGCSSANGSSPQANNLPVEDTLVAVSDELTPEELALVASGEAEASLASSSTIQDTL